MFVLGRLLSQRISTGQLFHTALRRLLQACNPSMHITFVGLGRAAISERVKQIDQGLMARAPRTWSSNRPFTGGWDGCGCPGRPAKEKTANST